MATLSSPLFPRPYGHSPSTTPPPTPFISLNWSKGVSPTLAYSLSSPPFPVARAGSHFCSRRNFIRLRRGKEEEEEGGEIWRGEEMSRSFHRAAYDAGAFITIRTGGKLTGDTCGDHPWPICFTPSRDKPRGTRVGSVENIWLTGRRGNSWVIFLP